MKKIILFNAIFILLISCQNSDMECNSDLNKQTVIELLLENELKESYKYNGSGVGEEEIVKVFRRYVEIKQVRTINQNDMDNSCTCEADLFFKTNDYIDQVIEDSRNDLLSQSIKRSTLALNGLPIRYNLLKTDDGEVLVEAFKVNNIRYPVVVYYGLWLKNYYDNIVQEEDSNTELTTEEIDKSESKTGTISATNVIFRDDPTIKSNIIGSFKNKGEEVMIIRSFVAKDKRDGLIARDTNVFIENKSYELVKNKAVSILSTKNNVSRIMFSDKDQQMRIVEIDQDLILETDNNTWFEVQRNDGTVGWVFAKFIDLN